MPPKRERDVDGEQTSPQTLRAEFFGVQLEPTGSSKRAVQLTTLKRLMPDTLLNWLYEQNTPEKPFNHHDDMMFIWNHWLGEWSGNTALPKATRVLLNAHWDDKTRSPVFPTIADPSSHYKHRLLHYNDIVLRFIMSMCPAIRTIDVLGQPVLDDLRTNFPSWPIGENRMNQCRFMYYLTMPFMKGGEDYWDEVIVRMKQFFDHFDVSTDLGPSYQYYITPFSIRDVIQGAHPNLHFDVSAGVDALRAMMRQSTLPLAISSDHLESKKRYFLCTYYGNLFNPYAGLDTSNTAKPYVGLVRGLSTPVLNSTVYLTLPGVFLPFQFSADGRNFFPIMPGWTTDAVLRLLGLRDAVGASGIMGVTWTFNPSGIRTMGTATRPADLDLPLPSWSILDNPPHLATGSGNTPKHKEPVSKRYGLGFSPTPHWELDGPPDRFLK